MINMAIEKYMEFADVNGVELEAEPTAEEMYALGLVRDADECKSRSNLPLLGLMGVF